MCRSDGRVVFASGSPYEPVEYKGRRYEPGQGNNMSEASFFLAYNYDRANDFFRYIFPALGLGTIISKANHVTDLMVEQSAIALAESLTPEEHAVELVYPRLGRIRQVSARIARAVVRAAQTDVSAISSCLCPHSYFLPYAR